MKALVGDADVLDSLGAHLPALWVAAAVVLGAATLASLEPPAPVVATSIELRSEAPTPPFPLEIGRVERVIDGDTYDVVLERTGEPVRVRLAWVDAPESAQAFGEAATQWAQEALLGQRVVLTVQDVDRHGRTVAQLSVAGEGEMWDVGATLARTGLGWVDPRYGEDQTSLREDQARAKSEGLGLWAEPDAVPPWEWRAGGQARQSGWEAAAHV